MIEHRGPRTPSPAQRAKSITARCGRAVLLASGAAFSRTAPLLHHVHPDGTVSILLDDGHPAVRLAGQPDRDRVVMLEIADHAPVPLREPIRGLLWVTGWLSVPEPRKARAQVLAVAEERPDSRLLDAGHGATVLRMDAASLVIADGAGTCSISPAEFAVAEPDPFCQLEDEWLRYLDVWHPDVVGTLVRHLPQNLHGGHIRPLGLDRYGLRLRVESADGDHDVRLAFSEPVTNAERFGAELRRLVGCPFLAQQRQA